MQELQAHMDAKVQELKTDLVAGQTRLQVNSPSSCYTSPVIPFCKFPVVPALRVTFAPFQAYGLVVNSLEALNTLVRLQDTHKKLQRTEGALDVAHTELQDLKSQFAEQEEAMHELQTTLDSKETLLNTISMAACEFQGTSGCHLCQFANVMQPS